MISQKKTDHLFLLILFTFFILLHPFISHAQINSLENEVVRIYFQSVDEKWQIMKTKKDVLRESLLTDFTAQIKNLAQQERNTLLRYFQRSRRLQNLRSLVEERKRLLERIIVINPKAILTETIPHDLRSVFPQNIQQNIEAFITEEGTFEPLHIDDFAKQRSADFLFLKVNDNTKYSLHFENKERAPSLSPGTRIRVQGVKIGKSIALSDSVENLSVVPSPSSTTPSSPKATGHTTPLPSAEISVSAIILNFRDSSRSPNRGYVQQIFTDAINLNSVYAEHSFGRITIRNNGVYGPYTIPASKNDECGWQPLYDWTAARQQARAEGWNGSSILILIVPDPNQCSFTGLRSGNMLWVNYANPLLASKDIFKHTILHEMGHSFGIEHSNLLDCSDSNGNRITLNRERFNYFEIPGSKCKKISYGDPFDFMGTGFATHLSNYHKHFLYFRDSGVLSPSNILTITNPGTYTIEPIEEASEGVKVLRIEREPSIFFYIEYRQPIGLDSYLSSSPLDMNGVLIRLGVDYYRNHSSTLLIDPTPRSDRPYALQVGKEFTDPLSGVSIRVNSVSSKDASVTVQFLGENFCVRRDPTIKVLPPLSRSQSGLLGERKIYYLAVFNNDEGKSCPVSNFAITQNLPVGFAQTPSQIVIEGLPAGESDLKSVIIKSLFGSLPRLVQFTETVKNREIPEYQHTTTLEYTTRSLSNSFEISPVVTDSGGRVLITLPKVVTGLSEFTFRCPSGTKVRFSDNNHSAVMQSYFAGNPCGRISRLTGTTHEMVVTNNVGTPQDITAVFTFYDDSYNILQQEKRITVNPATPLRLSVISPLQGSQLYPGFYAYDRDSDPGIRWTLEGSKTFVPDESAFAVDVLKGEKVLSGGTSQFNDTSVNKGYYYSMQYGIGRNVEFPPGNDYAIRVALRDPAGNVLASDKISFELLPEITVLAPNGGETIQQGSSYTIQWRTQGPLANTINNLNSSCVVLPTRTCLRYRGYLERSGTSQELFTAPLYPRIDSFEWRVPDSLGSDTGYKIKIVAEIEQIAPFQTGFYAVDESDASFTISPPRRTIFTPQSSTLSQPLLSHTLTLTQGQNFISSPLIESTPTPISSLKTTCTNLKASRYDNVKKIYTNADTLTGKASEGYRITADNNCTITLTGDRQRTPSDFTGMQMRTGINIIGAPSSPILFDQIKSSCQTSRAPITIEGGKSKSSTTLAPGRGYLVIVQRNCTLGSPRSSLPSSAQTGAVSSGVGGVGAESGGKFLQFFREVMSGGENGQ